MAAVIIRAGKGPVSADSPRCPNEKLSTLARAPPVQHSTVPFGRPAGTTIADSNGNGRSRRRRGCSIEIAGRGIGGTNPLVDHPYHLDYPRPVSDDGAHLVTRGHGRRRLGLPIVDPDTSTSTRGGGVRAGACQPDRPQPPIQPGRLHDVHHGPRKTAPAAWLRHGTDCNLRLPVPRRPNRISQRAGNRASVWIRSSNQGQVFLHTGDEPVGEAE